MEHTVVRYKVVMDLYESVWDGGWGSHPPNPPASTLSPIPLPLHTLHTQLLTQDMRNLERIIISL